MYAETESLNSVGFRHVVEDALAVLKGQALSQDRKHYVLSDLSKIISDAKVCSDSARVNTWYSAKSNRDAYELFSLLRHDIGLEGQPWQEWLDSASVVLNKLAFDEQDLDISQRNNASQLLEELLACLSSVPRRVSFSPLASDAVERWA